MTVAGFTIASESAHLDHVRDSRTQKALSMGRRRGRGVLRRSTASCCLRTRFSRHRRIGTELAVRWPSGRPWRLAPNCVADACLATTGGNICYYGDKKFDDRYSPPTEFSGEYSCKDSDSGRVVVREHRVRGVRNGPYVKYDARSGQIEESGS
jgi:hypothetical protein